MILKAIRNFFKIARLLTTLDEGDLRQCTIQTMGKTQKALLFTPYGLMSNPPSNSMAAVWSQQGHESNAIAMADDPANRTLKGLASGEVAVGNYQTGAYILFDAAGTCKIVANSIDLTAVTNISLTAPNVGNNGVNIGATHVHSQGVDSDSNIQQDTEVPH